MTTPLTFELKTAIILMMLVHFGNVGFFVAFNILFVKMIKEKRRFVDFKLKQSSI